MSRGKSIYHYATKSDYKSFFEQLALVIPLRFVLGASRVDSNFEVFGDPLNYPELECSRWRNGKSLRLIVIKPDAAIPFEYWPAREVPEKYGFFIYKPHYWHVQFDVSQLYVENGVTVGLLEGWISTNSENPDSVAIFDAMKKIIRKNWHRIGLCYLGPEALAYLRSGGRLSQSLDRPVEFDLREEPSPV
jgi:hypothetical protein